MAPASVCWWTLNIVTLVCLVAWPSWCQRTRPRGQASAASSGGGEPGKPKLASSIGDLFASLNSQQQHNKIDSEPATANSRRAALGAGQDHQYWCAKHCSCSLIRVMDSTKLESRANLTKVQCQSGQFSDLLTIDRRTQIIHISLPPETASRHQDTTRLDGPAMAGAEPNATTSRFFRMPRLAQFNLLLEIVIVNLRFEVCDSEVFKRGQRLRRLQWNHNQLRQISKACLRHLDNLIDLNLDFNQLQELESALFSNLLNLKSLSIAHNRLSELAAHQFANLTNLISLNLVGNSFKIINLHLFEPMQNSLRLLVLAKNQIKSFVYTIQQQRHQDWASTPTLNITNSSHPNIVQPFGSSQKSAGQLFSGAIFKKLVKLNVDYNKFERIKLLQLHRFYNVKFLSVRQNNIATIRDKAFNGLKLVELNLAQNQLQSISKCAFCNSTIKRLILAKNNMSVAPVSAGVLLDSLAVQPALWPVASDKFVPPPPSAAAQSSGAIESTNDQQPIASKQTDLINSPASSASMLILSQSIFGPLFGDLEYLDLSGNERLANDLEFLLEPLMELQYLNLASVGLDRSLPTPNLFKNLRHLKYLNLSHNQLDQLVSETIEPLSELEVFDISHNKFSELDESFLVSLDELPVLKWVNLAANPWYCSQCKIAPLYDWILRSSIYNSTCIAPLASDKLDADTNSNSNGHEPDVADGLGPDGNDGDVYGQPNEEQASTGLDGQADGPTYYRVREQSLARGPQDYSLLVDPTRPGGQLWVPASTTLQIVDFDLILGRPSSEEATNYRLFAPATGQQAGEAGREQPAPRRSVAELIRTLETSEDDGSVMRTMASSLAAAQVSSASEPESLAALHYFGSDFCLKCEFPTELRALNVHELAPADFKYCAGSAPRFAASEPKIGLTLAIIIIGALFCIIVVVIVMYRKKSNIYYPNEDITDHLEGGAAGKQPVVSVSSDAEHQYGDATDYSSPPMSQSYESYSPADEEEPEEEEEEDEDEEDYEGEEEADEQAHQFDDEEDTDDQGTSVSDARHSHLIFDEGQRRGRAGPADETPAALATGDAPARCSEPPAPRQQSADNGDARKSAASSSAPVGQQQPASSSGQTKPGSQGGAQKSSSASEAPQDSLQLRAESGLSEPLASLSVADLVTKTSSIDSKSAQIGRGSASQQHRAPSLIQLASVAGSLHGSQSRARWQHQAGQKSTTTSSSSHRDESGRSSNHNAGSRLKYHAHKQSSEHSTAGSVSFAHQHQRHYDQTHRGRRDRIQASRTFGGADSGQPVEAVAAEPRQRQQQLAGAAPGDGPRLATGRPAGGGESPTGGSGRQRCAMGARQTSRADNRAVPGALAHQARPRLVAEAEEEAEPDGGGLVAHGTGEARRQAELRALAGRARLAPAESGSATETSSAPDSVGLEAQLAELASELDESDVESLFASGGNLAGEWPGADEPDVADVGQLGPEVGRRMRESRSTHSALTQTSSHELQQ